MIASTFEGIIRSDRWFTLPGVIGILIGGFAAAIDGSLPILATGWILWPIILFTISGVVFGVWVAPLQGKIVSFVRAADASDQAWQSYEEMYKRWERWGLVALITPAVAVVIMVLKPSLPGL